MALNFPNDEVAEAFLQDENLQTEKKTYKSNFSGLKFGLSELSNDKTYLETEQPARKRLKSETRLFSKNITKHPNKDSTVLAQPTHFVMQGKPSIETSNMLFTEVSAEKNSPRTESLKSELNAKIIEQDELSTLKVDTDDSISSNDIPVNPFRLDSEKVIECNFEKKYVYPDLQSNSENDLFKNSDSNQRSKQNADSEIEFDDEVKKCCELLDLDVPKMTAVSEIENVNINFSLKNRIIENKNTSCEISSSSDKNLVGQKFQSNKLVAGLKSLSNDDNDTRLINLDTEGKSQNELEEKICHKNLNYKDEDITALSTVVISNAFSTNKNEKFINLSGELCHDEINTTIDETNTYKHINSTCIVNINLKNDCTPVKDTNVSDSEMFQNYDSKSNAEHQKLTTEDTQSSDTKSKCQEVMNQEHILQTQVNDDQDIANVVLSTAKDPNDILLLHYDESDIDYDETKETFSEIVSSECEPVKKSMAAFNTCLANESEMNTNNGVKKTNDCLVYKNINPEDGSCLLDKKNCELSILYDKSKNESSQTKTEFDIKEESFVSEYEISLLECSDSNFSEESIDSELEISLLEDDINDEENQNDIHEIKFDSNIESMAKLPIIDQDSKNNEKNTDVLQEYNVDSMIEQNVPSAPNQIFNSANKKDQSDNNININKKIISEITTKNNLSSKNTSENHMASCLEKKIQSICHKNDKTHLDVKISTQNEKSQTLSKIKLNQNTEQSCSVISVSKAFVKLKKPNFTKPEKPNAFDEVTISKNDSHNQKKLKVTDKYHILDKVIQNNIEVNKMEQKSTIVTNKLLADSSNTNKAITKQIGKADLDMPIADESKQKINKEFKTSNKVIINSKIEETKYSKEKIIVFPTKHQLLESIEGSIVEKTVKTDLGNAESAELKQDIVPDYYEEEKEDLINPAWNKIKELSTDEERYRQVRDCWKSKNIPNPFKNLTFYSYRKHQINSRENSTHQTRQHKRHATSNLSDKNAKRSRKCTYMFDNRIQSIAKEKEIKTKTLQNEMFSEVSRLNELCFQEQMKVQNQYNCYGYNFDQRDQQFELNNLRRDFEYRVSSVTAEYEQKVNQCKNQYTSEINNLRNNRNEILQFYSFYKGLNKNEYKDPTILTNAQMQELEEIENIYCQMDRYYT